MGRMLDALKRAEGKSDEVEAPAPAHQLPAEEEIPFIEVGPRKSMEASPSVLAAAPVPSLPGPKQPTALASTLRPNADLFGPMREMLLKTLDALPFADRLAVCEQALRALSDTIKSGPHG